MKFTKISVIVFFLFAAGAYAVSFADVRHAFIQTTNGKYFLMSGQIEKLAISQELKDALKMLNYSVTKEELDKVIEIESKRVEKGSAGIAEIDSLNTGSKQENGIEKQQVLQDEKNIQVFGSEAGKKKSPGPKTCDRNQN